MQRLMQVRRLHQNDVAILLLPTLSCNKLFPVQLRISAYQASLVAQHDQSILMDPDSCFFSRRPTSCECSHVIGTFSLIFHPFPKFLVLSLQFQLGRTIPPHSRSCLPPSFFFNVLYLLRSQMRNPEVIVLAFSAFISWHLHFVHPWCVLFRV